MLDITNIINRRNNVQTFTSPNTWQTWTKPRGAKLVDILCIGGGNGGNGSPYSSLSTGGGGSGGPSSPFIKATFPTNRLPDIIYIFTGAGGKGGIGQTGANADNTLTQGGISYVTVIPNTGSASGILCRSANTPATAGGTQTGSLATPANMILINLATSFTANPGQAGAGGSTDITPNTIVTGGAGGGLRAGANTGPAGIIIPTGPIPGPTKSVVNNVIREGPNGVVIYKPIFATTGGSGGEGFTNGGNAGYGSGGGGAAGMPSSATSTGTNGGNGGNGIVIITTTF